MTAAKLPDIKKVRERVRRGKGEKIFLSFLFVWFSLYVLSLFFMFGWALSSSLKTSLDFYNNTLGLPKQWRFSNYIEAFTLLEYGGYRYAGMVFNSLWQTLGALLIGLFSASTLGYVFAKYRFGGKTVMFTVIVTIMTLPIMGSGAASYKLIYDLRLNDSPLYLITSLGGYGINFMYFYAMYKGVSWNYAEAAFIDGAGHVYTYFRIMLPMALPAMFALGISGFIGGWNDYMTSFMYLRSMPSLAAGLYYFRTIVERQGWDPIYFAGSILSAVVPITIFIVFQNKVFDKVSFGGLKG